MLTDYCFKTQNTIQKAVQLGWGFFFFVCCWGFFFIGYTCDRPIIILESTGEDTDEILIRLGDHKSTCKYINVLSGE